MVDMTITAVWSRQLCYSFTHLINASTTSQGCYHNHFLYPSRAICQVLGQPFELVSPRRIFALSGRCLALYLMEYPLPDPVFFLVGRIFKALYLCPPLVQVDISKAPYGSNNVMSKSSPTSGFTFSHRLDKSHPSKVQWSNPSDIISRCMRYVSSPKAWLYYVYVIFTMWILFKSCIHAVLISIRLLQEPTLSLMAVPTPSFRFFLDGIYHIPPISKGNSLSLPSLSSFSLSHSMNNGLRVSFISQYSISIDE